MEKWDAGQMGCGQFILQLRNRMEGMGPGEAIEVVARDPGAPTDIPAWCRMTGHELVSMEHPVYVIRKKSESPLS